MATAGVKNYMTLIKDMAMGQAAAFLRGCTGQPIANSFLCFKKGRHVHMHMPKTVICLFLALQNYPLNAFKNVMP